MITKFIGSTNGLINCNSVSLVQVESGVILSQDKIKEYTQKNPLFIKSRSATRTVDGDFTCEFNDKSRSGFILNYIIMYNMLGSPIGFCNLTQEINLEKFKVKTVTVKLDYTVMTKDIFLELDIDYVSHKVLTDQKRAHAPLFDKNLGGYAATNVSELQKLTKRQGFTNKLTESLRDNRLLYRYSGAVSKGTNYFYNSTWTIPEKVFESSYFLEFVKIEGAEYLLMYDLINKTLHISNGDKIIDHKLNISSKLHIGSNFILETEQDNSSFKMYLTSDLVKNEVSPIKLNNTEVLLPMGGEFKDIVTNEVNILSDYKVAKDPIDKSLMLYRVDSDNNIITDCKYLQSILNDFGPIKASERLPIFCTKGMLFTAELNSRNEIEKGNCELMTHGLPGKKDKGYWKASYDSRYTNSDSDSIYDNFVESMKNVSIDDIIFLTPDLFVVWKSTNRFEDYRKDNKIKWTSNLSSEAIQVHGIPDEIDTDNFAYYLDMISWSKIRGSGITLYESALKFDYNTNQNYHELVDRPLTGRSGLLNYDKLIKYYYSKLKDWTLLNMAIDGSIFGFIKSGKTYILGKL